MTPTPDPAPASSYSEEARQRDYSKWLRSHPHFGTPTPRSTGIQIPTTVPDPAPEVKLSRTQTILAGLNGQNEPAEFEGRKGFWVQADAIFIEASSPQAAIEQYRRENVACSHNHFCGSILYAKANLELNTRPTPAPRDWMREAAEAIWAQEYTIDAGEIAATISCYAPDMAKLEAEVARLKTCLFQIQEAAKIAAADNERLRKVLKESQRALNDLALDLKHNMGNRGAMAAFAKDYADIARNALEGKE